MNIGTTNNIDTKIVSQKMKISRLESEVENIQAKIGKQDEQKTLLIADISQEWELTEEENTKNERKENKNKVDEQVKMLLN